MRQTDLPSTVVQTTTAPCSECYPTIYYHSCLDFHSPACTNSRCSHSDPSLCTEVPRSPLRTHGRSARDESWLPLHYEERPRSRSINACPQSWHTGRFGSSKLPLCCCCCCCLPLYVVALPSRSELAPAIIGK